MAMAVRLAVPLVPIPHISPIGLLLWHTTHQEIKLNQMSDERNSNYECIFAKLGRPARTIFPHENEILE